MNVALYSLHGASFLQTCKALSLRNTHSSVKRVLEMSLKIPPGLCVFESGGNEKPQEAGGQIAALQVVCFPLVFNVFILSYTVLSSAMAWLCPRAAQRKNKRK